MIDLETGRFTFGDGYELYQGMTKEEFLNSKYFKEKCEIKDEDINFETEIVFPMENIVIRDIELAIVVHFDLNGRVIKRLSITTPEFYGWSSDKWPKDSYERRKFQMNISDKLGQFLADEVRDSVESGRELGYSFPWGTIESSYRLEEYTNGPPDIKIYIKYYKKVIEPIAGLEEMSLDDQIKLLEEINAKLWKEYFDEE